LTFTGSIKQDESQLNWTLSDNKDLAGIDVEYSIDGVSFRRIGVVAPGSSTNYNYIHRNLNIGSNYYRLKLRDKNGASTYSKVILLTYKKAAITVIKALKSNPVERIAIVPVLSASVQIIRWKLVDLQGRVIRSGMQNLLQGENLVNAELPNIPNGFYHLYLVTEDGVRAALKMLKE
jgi:hypothetical protein